jgi:hypothetical protein
MKTNHVLIDFESVQVKSLALLEALHFRVHVFLGPSHTRLPRALAVAMHSLGERARYVELEAPGPNALDFHIAYYLGQMAAGDPEGFFHIISKDTGFDPLITHLKTRKIFAARSTSIEEMPCFRPGKSAQTATAGALSGDSLDGLVRITVDDLIKRKAARPRKVATLRATVLNRIGKDAAGSLDAVILALLREGYVATDGERVTYHLPTR